MATNTQNNPAALGVTNTTTTSPLPLAPPSINQPFLASKPFPDTSKIESFDGRYFKRWQERVFSALDVMGYSIAITKLKPDDTTSTKDQQEWHHANKVCRHTILSTLSNDLFDVYCNYKDAKQIWESLNKKFAVEDAGIQKFAIGNFLDFHMKDDKEVTTQINEFHKLLEDLRNKNIKLQEELLLDA